MRQITHKQHNKGYKEQNDGKEQRKGVNSYFFQNGGWFIVYYLDEFVFLKSVYIRQE
jgi:hypothetical protein